VSDVRRSVALERHSQLPEAAVKKLLVSTLPGAQRVKGGVGKTTVAAAIALELAHWLEELARGH
jgi:hypothetical protein